MKKFIAPWEHFLHAKHKELARASVVHDIGGGAHPQYKARYASYVLVDVDASYHPDIVADIQQLPFKDGSLEAILCLSVLEHVEDPFRAVRELYRVLKPGGTVLVSVPFIWPYHASSHYKDYWRFSEDGVRALFKAFPHIEVVRAGGYFSALVNFIPSFTRIDRVFRPLARRIDTLLLRTKRSTAPSYFVFVKK